MKRLLALAAAPLLFAAGCSSTGGPLETAPTTAPAAAPGDSPSAATGDSPSAATGAGSSASAGGSATGAGSGAGTRSGSASAKPAGTPRCHTGDLKVSLGAGDGAAGTTY